MKPNRAIMFFLTLFSLFFVMNPGRCPEQVQDFDFDGVGNDLDNCPGQANPDQNDTDGDTVGDACDNCPQKNAPQTDSDDDGIGDACDNCPLISNFDQYESDGDTLGNACDNCPSRSNIDQKDQDTDKIGDVCDNCPSRSNKDQKDQDGDSIGDSCDNCPQQSNTDQKDQDNDKIGDSCDNCPQQNNADQNNKDHDLSGDVCDNCPEVANQDQVDRDNDGFGDSCDPDCFWYRDEDGDGYGNPDSKIVDCNHQSAPYVNKGGDCDDVNDSIHPGQLDICNDGIDNDCDGWADFPRAACLACALTIPDDQPSIQAGINAANPGDLICVRNGVYQEDINFSGKNVGVYSLDGPQYTTIKGNHRRAVVTFVSGENAAAAIDGFTITNGSRGIVIDNASPQLRHLIVTGNTGADGYSGGNEYSLNGGQGDSGGGIALFNSASYLFDLIIENNAAGDGGDGYLDYDDRCQCYIGETGDGGNGGDGGGIFIQNATPRLERIWLYHNSAGQGGYGYYLGDEGNGGGISIVDSSVELEQIGLIENSAGDGGGIYISNPATGDNYINISNTFILVNRADLGFGGGIWVEGDFMLTNATLIGNLAKAGGGILGYDGMGLIINSTISDSVGTGIYSLFTLLTVIYSNAWNNSPENYIGLTVPIGSAGNMVTDPQFYDTASVDPLQWNLHLRSTSPLIDAGYPALPDSDGSPADIGAYGGPAGVW